MSASLSSCLLGSGGSGFSNQPGGAHDEAVSLAITSPTSASAIDTTDRSLDLGGTAASEQGISRITWQNDRGGSGIAEGTDAWQIDDIALALGENMITVTAEDASGARNSLSLVVNRESGQPGSTTLSWNAPTSRVDGTPLDNLAGYRIYYGRMSGIYDYTIDVDNPGVLTYVVDGLVSGHWYFALSAYDEDGVESERSGEVRRRIS